MAANHRTLVMTATYNEIENLPRLVEAVFAVCPGVDMLVVDDNSPDGTGRWCDQHAAAEPRLHCLHRAGKLGLGTAILSGLRYAVDHGYDLVVNMDADFSHAPQDLPALLAGMEASGSGPAADVMIGSRYVPGGAIVGWPLKRHLMSRGVNVYARTMLGLAAKDCSAGFRCYRTERLAALDFEAIRSRGYVFQEEMLWRLKREGAVIGETPVTFVDRERGASKISSRDAFEAIRTIFALAAQHWFGR